MGIGFGFGLGLELGLGLGLALGLGLKLGLPFGLVPPEQGRAAAVVGVRLVRAGVGLRFGFG